VTIESNELLASMGFNGTPIEVESNCFRSLFVFPDVERDEEAEEAQQISL
jgi:hypothetical protein